MVVTVDIVKNVDTVNTLDNVNAVNTIREAIHNKKSQSYAQVLYPP